MKKYLFVVFSAILIGGGFAYYIFSIPSDDAVLAMSSEEKVYIFQLGAFTSLENANNKKDSSDAAIIQQINEYYYVYGAIYSNVYLVGLLKDYYDENNIDYQVKETFISEEFLIELQSYEDLLTESKNMEVILRTNQIILDKYAIL